jgi:uncharacterized protein YecE (DUF72 family)
MDDFLNKVKIGTSGFSFDDWKGTVYPNQLKREDWLQYYEEVMGFKILEINFTYYTIPSPKSFSTMCNKTSKVFEFAVKAHRGITHEVTSQNSVRPEIFDKFLSALGPLIEHGKLSCVLAQFPYSFTPTSQNLDYLSRLKEYLGDIPLTIEFRNRSWLKEETFLFLKEHLLGYCIVDEPKLSKLMPFHPLVTSDLSYFRFHGRNIRWFNTPSSIRYNYFYSEEELQGFLPSIKMIASQAKKILVFFNNCHGGSAAKNALMMTKLLKEGEPINH